MKAMGSEERVYLNRTLLRWCVVLCLTGMLLVPGYGQSPTRPRRINKAKEEAAESNGYEADSPSKPSKRWVNPSWMASNREKRDVWAESLEDVGKLLIAALLGLLVAAAHRRIGKERAINVSLAHAQVLLCVAGAFMMILIGNSLARAFGLAGAAAFIRFRTPVKNPRDTTVLFLLVGIGMACGIGIYLIALLTSLALIGFLWVLDVGASRQIKRSLTLEIEAKGFEQAQQFVQDVLTRNGVKFEVRKITRDETSLFRYDVQMDPQVPIERINAQIFNGQGDSVRSVSWEVAKGSS